MSDVETYIKAFNDLNIDNLMLQFENHCFHADTLVRKIVNVHSYSKISGVPQRSGRCGISPLWVPWARPGNLFNYRISSDSFCRNSSERDVANSKYSIRIWLVRDYSFVLAERLAHATLSLRFLELGTVSRSSSFFQWYEDCDMAYVNFRHHGHDTKDGQSRLNKYHVSLIRLFVKFFWRDNKTVVWNLDNICFCFKMMYGPKNPLYYLTKYDFAWVPCLFSNHNLWKNFRCLGLYEFKNLKGEDISEQAWHYKLLDSELALKDKTFFSTVSGGSKCKENMTPWRCRGFTSEEWLDVNEVRQYATIDSFTLWFSEHLDRPGELGRSADNGYFWEGVPYGKKLPGVLKHVAADSAHFKHRFR